MNAGPAKRKMKRTRMTPAARKLLFFLIEHVKAHRIRGWRHRYDVAELEDRLESAKLAYGEALNGAGLKIMAVKAGHLAGQIARLCMRNKLAPLNALLVNSRSRQPGQHYLGLDPTVDLFAVLAFDWSDELCAEIEKSIIEVPVFKQQYWTGV